MPRPVRTTAEANMHLFDNMKSGQLGPVRWLLLKNGTKVLQQSWLGVSAGEPVVLWMDVPMDLET